MFRTASRSDRVHDWARLSLVLGALLLCYYVLPLVSLLVSQPTAAVLSKLGDPEVRAAARTSLLSATTTTLLATVCGLPLAYWLARSDSRLSTLVTAAVVLPLVLPPIVGGMVVLSVVRSGTLLGDAAASVGVELTRSFAGVVLAQLFVASPFVVVTARSAFASVDRELEYASRSLGKSPLTTATRVTLPLAWPGIVAGMTLTFTRSMGEFGATVMLAYYPRTMPVQIWVSFSALGLENAFPVAVVLVGISVGGLVVLNALGSTPWR